MKKIIYLLCTRDGCFEDILILHPTQIIFEATIENGDGTYYLEWVEGDGEHSGHFLKKVEVESITEITIKS